MDSFFIVFIYRLDELGPPIARYRVPALMTKASLSVQP